MNTFSKALAATAAAAAMSMTAASAQAALWIGYSTDGGATITDLVSGDPDGVYGYIFNGNFGGFETLVLSGDTGFLPDLLHASSVSANNSGGGGASVTLFFTHTDIHYNNGGSYIYEYANTSTTAGQAITYTTFVDDANGVYTGTQIATGNYPFPSGPKYTGGPAVTDPFSVTHRFDISITGLGSAAPSAALAAVPEPGTWALMIIGFGGAGAMIRRRKALAFA